MSAPVQPIVQMRLCAARDCDVRFQHPHGGNWRRAFCSRACSDRDTRSRTAPAKPRSPLVTRPTTKQRRAISPASPEQRAATRDRACIVDTAHGTSCHPAHLISRAALSAGQDDPRATVPLCPACHHRYDQGGDLDLLPYLEPAFRVELAFAVERFGLLATLRRVTNDRAADSLPTRSDAC